MRRHVAFLALLASALTSTGWASYTIDGNLSDWGVTPFSDWVPNPPANYTQTDNVNLYNAAAYDESADAEAMYFDNDAQNFYFGVVSSHGVGTTDFGIDLTEDMAISSHGVVTGLDYAIYLDGPEMGQVVYNPTWVDTVLVEWPDGWQGSPWKATGGTLVGNASIAVVEYPGMESGTHIIEIAVPRNIFPGDGGDTGDLVGTHFSMWCGNDSINLVGDIYGVILPPPPTIPAPGAIVLGSLGISLVGWLRRRRTLA